MHRDRFKTHTCKTTQTLLYSENLSIDSVCFQGYTVVENFFTLEEIEPCRESYRHLVDEIAQKLYKTGRVKSKFSQTCVK